MNTPLQQALSTSAFLYIMDKDLVQQTFVSPGQGPVIPLDRQTNLKMADFLRSVCHAINSQPIDSIEVYFSSVLDRHLIQEVLVSSSNKPFWSVHGPYGRYQDISSPVASSRATAIKYFKEALLFANSLGAGTIVVHPGFSAVHDIPRAERFAFSVESLKAIADLAGEHGVVPAVEPLPNEEIGCSIEEVLELLELANRPNLKVNFDTNHLFPAADIPGMISQCKGLLASVHISDQDDRERHWLPFQGKLDWNKIVIALEQAEYTGPLVYETHVRGAADAEDVARIASENFSQLKQTVQVPDIC